MPLMLTSYVVLNLARLRLDRPRYGTIPPYPHELAQLASDALDPQTPADRLRQIAEWSGMAGLESWLREAVALNPNTPPDVLRDLLLFHPQLVVRNPALDLAVLERPDVWRALPGILCQELLRRSQVSRPLLASLTDHPEHEVAMAARHHVGLSGEVGPGWARELSGAFAEACTPVYDRLLEIVELGLAPALVMEAAAASGEFAALRAVVAGMARSAECEGLAGLLERAAGSRRAGRLARPDPTLPSRALAQLARGGAWARIVAARHPNTPREDLVRLAGDALRPVRVRVARNPSTPDEIRVRLADDRDPCVRRSASLAKKRRPEEDITLEMSSPKADRGIPTLGACNPDAPIEILARYPRPVLRALGNTLPPEKLADIRDHLLTLVFSGSADDRCFVAGHPLTPIDLQLKLVRHSEVPARLRLARRPDLSVHTLVRLRHQARVHAVSEFHPVCRFVGILHLEAAALQAEPYLASCHWVDRLAAALHPATPEGDLAPLLDDGNRFVRAAVRARLKVPLPDSVREGGLRTTDPGSFVSSGNAERTRE